MSRQDAGAASGQQVYPPLTRCVCEHLETFHRTMPDGRCGPCSAFTCPCPGFTEKEEGR